MIAAFNAATFSWPWSSAADMVRAMFRYANIRVSDWMLTQRSHETGLDHIFLQALLDFGDVFALDLARHGLRVGISFEGNAHHVGSFEALDIALAIEGVGACDKFVFLQTKRLYGSLSTASSSPLTGSLPGNLNAAVDRAYNGVALTYDAMSTYQAMKLANIRKPRWTSGKVANQMQAIEFVERGGVPVYYMLYSPERVATSTVGVVVARSLRLHARLRASSAGDPRSFGHISGLGRHLRRVEDFIADDVLPCYSALDITLKNPRARAGAVMDDIRPRVAVTISAEGGRRMERVSRFRARREAEAESGAD